MALLVALVVWHVLLGLAWVALVFLPCFEGETRGTRALRHFVLFLREPWHALRRELHHVAGMCREAWPRTR